MSFSSLSVLTLASIETLINKALALDSATAQKVSALHGKCLSIEITTLNFTFFITSLDTELRLQSTWETIPDATLKGSAKALMKMLINRDKTVAILTNDVEVMGDTSVIQTMQTVFSNLHIDWEQQLAGITGGIVAHEISHIARTVNNWSKNTFSHFAEDIKEYMAEEAPFKTPRGKVEEYLTEIDELKLRIDRMDAHIKELNEKLGKTN